MMGRASKKTLFADDMAACSISREHVKRRAMEERGLKISRKETEYLGCNEHLDALYPFTGRYNKRVEKFKYILSTFEVDWEVTRRVQSEWTNWKRGSGMLCAKMNVKINGNTDIIESGGGGGYQRKFTQVG